MTLEENFLEIYDEVSDRELEAFYSSDLKDVDLNSGNIGRTIHRVLEKYDLPIDTERESPADPSLFIVEEHLGYSDVEELLDSPEEERDRETLLQEAKEKLSDEQYSDTDLNRLLKEATDRYFNSFSRQVEATAELKDRLKDEGMIAGNSIDGWTVETR